MSRQCGDCQLCCKLLPVNEADQRTGRLQRVVVHKKAGERCPHQRHHKGCAVYALRPVACEMWNCRWLVSDDTADLPRPDRCHYVIDIMPDIIRLRDNATGEAQELYVVVVWVDPDYRDAYKDPALLRYIERRAKADKTPTMIRWSREDAMVLFPPSLCADGQWHEHRAPPTPGFKGFADRLHELNRARRANP